MLVYSREKVFEHEQLVRCLMDILLLNYNKLKLQGSASTFLYFFEGHQEKKGGR